MKGKENQILAIAQDLSDCLEYDIENSGVVDTYDTAYKLVNKGWVKADEDSVVLTKEEYNKKKKPLNITHFEKVVKENEKLNNKIEGLKKIITLYSNDIKKIRKETAREFLQLAYDRCLEKSFIKKVEELAKQFGVDIEE